MNLLPGEVVGTGQQTTIRLEGGGSAVSAVPTQDGDRGLEVNVGIRPEDFVETDSDGIYHGIVDFVEALGEVTLLYFKPEADREPVLGKLQGIHRNVRGNDVRLTADPGKVHLFSNGVSLLYR